MTRVLLVNMPFAALDTPSLALGLFKSRLRQDGIPCDVQNFNFTFAEIVGQENYEFMLRLSGILGGEQLFARAVFGDDLPPDEEYYREALSSNSATPDTVARLEQLRSSVPTFLQYCLDTTPWQSYDIIGFTSLFEQNLASLAMARLVKERYPEKVIVFGGANCEDIMGLTLHRCFPFVDFVCAGEADDSFPELVKRLKYHHPVKGLPGLVHRENGKSVYAGPARVIEDLDVLPVPDYDDYFDRLRVSPLRNRIGPSILVESARGCWWGEKSHCTFCGLNGLTMAFRTKTVDRTIEEISDLMERYPARIVRFVDNILAPSYFRDLLPEIARQGLKANYICEVKSNLKKNQIKVLAEAGVTVQAGIENLSTHVLDLMAKGSNALMNIQTLKWCKQYGVLADWNLLYGFPGEVPEDYEKNLDLVKVISHLDPPAGCGPIRLDRFSPNYNRAGEKGLTNVRPFKFYKYCYAFDDRTLSDLIYYFDFDYKEEIDDGGYIPSLEETVIRWKNVRDSLYVERVNSGLVIRDSRPVATYPELSVTGIAARIYEYCDRAQTLSRIVEVMKESVEEGVTEEQVSRILEEFINRKLMVQEGNRYLSLAVMTYTTDFEQQESERVEARANKPIEAVPQLVQLQPMMAR
jgi:ribosomal peptide maturation radical SAM protein 1